MQIVTESAMEIIDIVLRVVSEPGWKQSLLGAWWFSLYYSEIILRALGRKLVVYADKLLAFNAAVVLIGAIWVYRDTTLSSTPMTAQAKKVQQYPGRAVMALFKLDDGNRLIDRCRYYLEQFNKILVDPGMCFLYHLSSCSDTPC